MTAKEKDQVLAEIKADTFNYKKSLHCDIVNELEEGGYIKITRTKDGDFYDITDKGKVFIKEGGYIAANKKNALEWCKKHASKIFYIILTVAAGILAKFLLPL